MRTHSKIIIGHHLILHGYRHWLPNDPRGSGSIEIRDEKLSDLGPVHTGRKNSSLRETSCENSSKLLNLCLISH